MAERMVATDAEDTRAGMTLAELADLLGQARNQNCPGDTVVRIRSTFRGSIRRAELRWTPPERCTGRDGTLACALVAGHEGAHHG